MQRSRLEVRELKAAARGGDAEATKQLLAHSVASGHDRLSARRYLFAKALGATGLDRFQKFGRDAARRMESDAVFRIARDAARFARDCKIRSTGASNDREMSNRDPLTMPFILSFDGIAPKFATEPRLCGERASVLGKVTIGSHALLASDSVIRADGHYVQIGDHFCLGETSTVHIAHEIYPAIIGDRVTVGQNSVVHACTVGDDCLIEDDVVILDGSVVEDRVIMERGSTIYPRSRLRSGLVYGGSPAIEIRKVTDEDFRERGQRIHQGIAASLFSKSEGSSPANFERLDEAFVARTAILAGNINLHPKSSVFFSCMLDAGPASIVIHENSNVQDNTRILCSRDGVSIGCDTTIGHNVVMKDCTIGERSLIGIGSVIADGTVIESDVLLAAGSVTEPSQRLRSDWFWAGKPARPVSKLSSVRRAMMHPVIGQYCAYGDAYRELQKQIGRGG